MRLDAAPWGPAKIARRLLKWTIWLLIAAGTGGAWIFYFADAPTLAAQLWHGTAAPIAYSTIFVLTMTTFIFGGFMREQVCIYMCPWPRIQTAMLDEQSLIVTYKDWRGEPRGSKKQADAAPDAFGDCVDCHQCVAVCPTGIDIREGPQIGCITCALCIDACDTVMAQVGRPRGLIDYATADDCARERRGDATAPVLQTLLRARTIIYFSVWAAIGAALLFTLGTRTRIDISAQQDRNPVYVQLSNGDVRNAYTVRLRNMESRPRDMAVSLSGLPGARLWQNEDDAASATYTTRVAVPADSVARITLFVAAPGAGPQRTPFTLTTRALDREGGSDSDTLTFERPQEP
jgi:cytochrome c oxidase accessory protein FixG